MTAQLLVDKRKVKALQSVIQNRYRSRFDSAPQDGRENTEAIGQSGGTYQAGVRKHKNTANSIIVSKNKQPTHLKHDAIGSNCLGNLVVFQAMGQQFGLPREIDTVAVRMSHLIESSTVRARLVHWRRQLRNTLDTARYRTKAAQAPRSHQQHELGNTAKGRVVIANVVEFAKWNTQEIKFDVTSIAGHQPTLLPRDCIDSYWVQSVGVYSLRPYPISAERVQQMDAPTTTNW